MASMVQILPDLNTNQTPERHAQLLSDYVNALVELRAAIGTAPPPDDIAEHHLEYLEVIDENIALYASMLQQTQTGDDADPPEVSQEQITRLQRLFSATGDPIAPPEARARLLESANSVEECGGVAFPVFSLGPKRNSGVAQGAPRRRPRLTRVPSRQAP